MDRLRGSFAAHVHAGAVEAIQRTDGAMRLNVQLGVARSCHCLSQPSYRLPCTCHECPVQGTRQPST
jgi:hypothetical protein